MPDLNKETNQKFWDTTNYHRGQPLDPRNAEDARMAKVWKQIYAQVKADAIAKETNARFWAQTHYKVNQKLDMANAKDKAMSQTWLAINRKVRSEDAAGRLHFTYDDPTVVASLADAEVAERAATEHVKAAAVTDDPAVKQANIDAANEAVDISVTKGNEAAANQPPSVPPKMATEPLAPPPKNASPADHIAHVKNTRHVTKAVENMLVMETNARFWAQTHFRPGKKLDRMNPTDVRMMRVWYDVFNKVRREYAAGNLKTTYDHPVVAQNIADAHAAHHESADHLDAAAGATDPITKQGHLDAAASTLDIVAQKLKEAAGIQPSTVSPDVVADATKNATPPPAGASAEEQLAHVQSQTAAEKSGGLFSGGSKLPLAIGAIALLGGGAWWLSQRGGKSAPSGGASRVSISLPHARPSAKSPRAKSARTAVVRALPAPSPAQMAVR